MEVEWVLRERGSGTRSVFEDALAEFGLKARTLRIALELPSNEAVRSAAEAGLGAAVISPSIAAPSLEAGLLQLPATETLVRTTYAKAKPAGTSGGAEVADVGAKSTGQLVG